MKNKSKLLIFLLLTTLAFAKSPMKRGEAVFRKGDFPLQINGYEEYEFNSLKTSGKTQQYIKDSRYTSLPSSVKVYSGLRHRRLLDIEGQMTEDLYLRYKIYQEPNMPDDVEIYVEYDRWSIYFGKFDAIIKNGSLVNVVKGIDGFQFEWQEKDWDLTVINGQEKSHSREFSFTGNGKMLYSLGQKNILEGSLSVYLNNQKLPPSSYEIDYFEGTIKFNKILSSLDKVNGSYQYTNPIEDFLPITSKVALTGFKHKFQKERGSAEIYQTAAGSFLLESKDDNVGQTVPDFLQAKYYDRDYSKLTPEQLTELPDYFATVEGNDFLETYLIEQTYQTVTQAVTVNNVSIDLRTSENALQVVTLDQKIENKRLLDFIVLPHFILKLNKNRFTTNEQLIAVISNLENPEIVPSADFVDEMVTFNRVGDDYHLIKDLQTINQGQNYFYINYQNERYKIPFYLTNAEKDLVTVQLKDQYLIPFTEEVLVNGNKLEAKWYKINYKTGEISFFNPLPAGSKVQVNYNHYLVRTEKDSFFGNDKKGPYPLKNRQLIEDSVIVKINDIVLPDAYSLDYKEGTIKFARVIGNDEKIDIEYACHLMSKQAVTSQPQKLFTAESFYVKESAKSAEGSNVKNVSVSGSRLKLAYQNGKTVISLPADTLPIVADSLKLMIDDLPITDYIVEDYRGYIYVTGNYLPNKIVASYDYYKNSLAPKVYFTGSDVIGSMINLDLIYPIVYNSDLELKVYRGNSGTYEYLKYGKDFIIGLPEDLIGIDGEYAKVTYNENAWKRGLITFVTPNTGYSNFNVLTNWQYDQKDNFTLTYYTADRDKLEASDVFHEMYGTNLSFKPNKLFDVNLEMVRSVKKYQRAIATYRSEFYGNGQADTKYLLKKPLGVANLEIVKDSERVYINGVLQAQMEDYYLEYNGGILRFRNGRIIGREDLIVVEYEYYASSGTTDLINDVGDALKLNTKFNFDRVEGGFSYVTINEKFDSLGSIAYASGSKAKSFYVNYKPLNNLDVGGQVENQSIKKGGYEENSAIPVYQEKTLQSYYLNYGFWKNTRLNLSYRRNDVFEPVHKLASSNYLLDTKELNYEAKFGIGEERFRNELYLTNKENFTDVLDKENETKTYVRKHGLTNTWKPFTNMSFVTKFNRNEDDQFLAYRKRSITEVFSESFSYSPWTFAFNLNHNISNYFNFQSTTENYSQFVRNFGQDIDNFYSVAFREPKEWKSAPLKNFYSRYSKRHLVNRSALKDQSPDLEQEEKYTLSGFPFSIASLGWDATVKTWNKKNNHDYKHYKNNSYSLKDFYLFRSINPWQIFREDGLVVELISYSHSRDYNSNDLVSGKRLSTTRLSFKEKYEQKYSVPLLDNLKLTYHQVNSYDDDSTEEIYVSGIGKNLKNNKSIVSSYLLDYNQKDLAGFKNIHFDWLRKNSVSEKISKTKKAEAVSFNKTADIDNQLTDSGLLSYSWSSFDFRNVLNRKEQLYSQEKKGSRYSFGQTDSFFSRYNSFLIRSLNFKYSWNKEYNLQYKNLQPHKSFNYLEKHYHQFLYKIDHTQQLGLDYAPISKLLLDGSFYWQNVYQDSKQLNPRKKTHLIIDSNSFEAGLKYLPDRNISVRYGVRKYFYKSGAGGSDTLTISWQIPYLDKFTYHYENIISYGKGTNINEQEFNEKEKQGYVLTRVVDRHDIRTTNKLEIDLTKNIKNLVTDKLIVKIYLNHFKLFDKVNPDYNYSVNSFYAKGTIQF